MSSIVGTTKTVRETKGLKVGTVCAVEKWFDQLDTLKGCEKWIHSRHGNLYSEKQN